MKRGVRSSQLLVIVTLGLAGVVFGHVGEYLLLAPNHHERHERLVRTGHHYLPSALELAAFVALLVLAFVFLVGLARGRGRHCQSARAVPWWRALPAAQMLAFTALEVGERVAAHASLDDIVVVLAVGLPLQAAVGFLAGRLVAEVEDAGERLGERLRATHLHVRRSPPVGWLAGRWFRPAPSPFAVAVPARGPPIVLLAA